MNQQGGYRRSRTYLSAAVCAIASLLVCSASSGASPGTVQTLAGSGLAGYKDGPAASAQFVLPTAVAYDHSGRLFIVDQGAQRIRAFSRGVVTTIAGSGRMNEEGYVAGGYKDGAALSAHFNEPAAIAAGSDGSIYVADELNHCIRRIKDGMVSTFAGIPGHAGSTDGPRTSAQFMFPRALAIDAGNNLYVADYTVGIRKIDGSGDVATLPTPVSGKQFVGVSTWGSGSTGVVFAVDNAGNFHRYRNGKPVETYGFGGVGPQPYGIYATSQDSFLATDVRANVIRSIRLPQQPYVTQSISVTLAGTALESGNNGAGYQNGAAPNAKFYNPFGIAVSGNTVAIADTGNHRLRVMPLPDLRGPVTLGSPELAPDPLRYRILYIGLSHAFYDTAWSDSIGGLIESKLVARKGELGLARTPRLSIARIDGAGINGLNDFIDASAGDGQFDLVILSIVPEALFRIPAGNNPATYTPGVLNKLNSKLRKNGVKLFVFLMPDSLIAPADGGGTDLPPPQNLEPAILARQTDSIAILKSAHVEQYSALQDVLKYERQGDHRQPIWIFTDRHPSRFGREFMAREIIERLSTWRPWSSK